MRPRRAETSEPAWVKRKMLSMNRRTSCPSKSRKYSASVRPVRPTRRRAPGGSVIWPYTKAVLLITPDSFISSQRSFPSRVRSPTPAKTDTPPCFSATLWISSWMRTVLPTPAPPNSPVLPPFRYGSRRSMTLMPVSNICISVFCSSNEGASRWIGREVFAWIGPSLSTGLPRTFMTRPRTSSPTGTRIGPPVSAAGMPRTMPSVGSIATQRARPSPRCCSTSTITSIGTGTSNPWLVIRTALWTAGRFSSVNSTSTTGPMICTTLPTFMSPTLPISSGRRPAPRPSQGAAAEAADLRPRLDRLGAVGALHRVPLRRGASPRAARGAGARRGHRPAVLVALLQLEDRLAEVLRIGHVGDRRRPLRRGRLDVQRAVPQHPPPDPLDAGDVVDGVERAVHDPHLQDARFVDHPLRGDRPEVGAPVEPAPQRPAADDGGQRADRRDDVRPVHESGRPQAPQQ